MNTLTGVPVYDGDKFSWGVDNSSGRKQRYGVCEASTLRNFRLARVWDDAADVGCWVRSHRTGKSVLFTLKKQVRDGGGDICWWLLESTPDPKGTRINLTILND